MEENQVIENEIIENVVIEDATLSDQLNQIHTDLGLILCFIIFFVLVVLLKYAYKFFDMCFKF